MVKKFCRFIGALAALAILAFTPMPTLGQMGVSALSTEESSFTAPTQNNTLGKIGSYEIYSWTKDLLDTTVTEQITRDNIDDFNTHQYPDALTISHDQLNDKKAVVMTNKVKNTLVKGSYTSSEITLGADGFYKIAVDYLVKGDNSTFYLNDYEISLAARDSWHQSAFYVRTDNLATAKITAQLYLGSRYGAKDGMISGAVYYADFTIEAISEKEYTRETADLAYDEKVIDFTNTTDVKLLDDLGCDNFHVVDANPGVDNNINLVDVANILKFKNVDTIYNKDGTNNGQVMLLATNDGFATLKSNTDIFKPVPHGVYMFQFYSLTSSATEDTLDFFFNIGETPYNIKSINYNYKYGWQLNTFFYIANTDADQEYDLSFTMGSADEITTGWACIDGLRIYRVSGSYATDNASAVGVHYTEDRNKGKTTTITNGYFDLGTASDLTTPSYPYPLTADTWTTDGAENGIVNTNYWQGIAATNPGKISDNYTLNNNIYMMRNTQRTTNTLTSPVFSTTTGSTTYISFDAVAQPATKTQVTLILDGSTELSTLDINDGAWHSYEFAIVESDFATTHDYQLRFTMQNIGETFIDHVRKGDTANTLSGCPKTQQTVDLTNYTAFPDIWQTEGQEPFVQVDADGIMLRNVGDVTTTITNSLTYSLTTGNYYKLTLNAYGQNAWVQLSGFSNSLAINHDQSTDDSTQTYTLYFQATDNTTQTNFMVLLGSQSANEFVPACLYLSDLKLESIEDVVYELAKKQQDDNEYSTVLIAATEDDTAEPDDTEQDTSGDDFNFFGQNWWYLIPTLITAVAVVLAVTSFLIHKIKFDKHITTKTTSYARDVKIKTSKQKIVAEQSAKVDNSNTDESQNN